MSCRLSKSVAEIVEQHHLSAQAMAVPGAMDCLLERKITANQVGSGLVDEMRGCRATLERPGLPSCWSEDSPRTTCPATPGPASSPLSERPPGGQPCSATTSTNAWFEQRAAESVVVARMPKMRAAMHLDTVFTPPSSMTSIRCGDACSPGCHRLTSAAEGSEN